jgi:hypothetical protein
MQNKIWFVVDKDLVFFNLKYNQKFEKSKIIKDSLKLNLKQCRSKHTLF